MAEQLGSLTNAEIADLCEPVDPATKVCSSTKYILIYFLF